MQLNGSLFKGIRRVRAFWVSILAIIFGLAFIGLGVYFFVSDQNKTYELTTATITGIYSETIGEEENQYVTISYEDKDGNSYIDVRLNAYDSSWSIGKEIEIKYNAADPTEVRTTAPSFIAPLIAIILGSISLVVGICVSIKTIKSLKRKNVNNEEENLEDIQHSTILKNTKLFFHYSGKLNQSFTVENKMGESVYECKLIKFNPFASNLYEFTDLKTGYKKQYKIGKTVTSSTDGGILFVGDILSSGFKINGVNCWDYISNKGYEVKHLLEGKTIISYQILKNNNVVANIFPANVKDPFNENSMNFLRMGKGCYRLEIIDANLSDIIMIAFIISKTYIVQ